MKSLIYHSDNNNSITTGIIEFNNDLYIKLNLTNIPSHDLINNKPSVNANFILPIINKNFGNIFEYLNYQYDITM
jgi:hypothetical protein